uniref:Uncharacterized protein n=1 Tax=Lotharella oceanica TaxID=641309 RepID=A0A7S2XDZ4_9EUKA|mmetsp:Transcript_33065/g.61455  ORF Transcript_33065/g.61455 Transcript_33065/m.61455 type:complete len:251 (+) Transcript_33065:78-830(+)
MCHVRCEKVERTKRLEHPQRYQDDEDGTMGDGSAASSSRINILDPEEMQTKAGQNVIERLKREQKTLERFQKSFSWYKVVGPNGIGFRLRPNLSMRADLWHTPEQGKTFLAANQYVHGIERRTGWIQAGGQWQFWWLPIHIFDRPQLEKLENDEQPPPDALLDLVNFTHIPDKEDREEAMRNAAKRLRTTKRLTKKTREHEEDQKEEDGDDDDLLPDIDIKNFIVDEAEESGGDCEEAEGFLNPSAIDTV